MSRRFILPSAPAAVATLSAIATLTLLSTSTSACPQTLNPDANAGIAKTPQADAAAQKPAAAPAKPTTGKVEDRSFKDVPADSPLYAAVSELQQQGVLSNYPEGYFRGRRPLTYYEFSVALVRTAKDWDVLTLAPGGKTLETVVAVPRNLTLDQAQKMLSVWTEIRNEAGASGFGAAKTNLIIRTLRAYVNLLTTNNPAKPTSPSNTKSDVPKEQK